MHSKVANRITAAALDYAFGDYWKQTPEELDFSGPSFHLVSIDELGRAGQPEAADELGAALKLSALKTLDLSSNVLTSVGNVFQSATAFPSLERLRLAHNSIVKFNIEFPTLIELDLSYNHLVMSPFLDKLPNLRKINLRANQIEKLSLFSDSTANYYATVLKDAAHTAVGHPVLESIDLSKNDLNMLPTDLFRTAKLFSYAFPKVRELKLGGNPMTAGFPHYWVYVLKMMPALEVLDQLELVEGCWTDTETGQAICWSEEVVTMDPNLGGYVGNGGLAIWPIAWYDQHYEQNSHVVVRGLRNANATPNDETLEYEITLDYNLDQGLEIYLGRYLKDLARSSMPNEILQKKFYLACHELSRLPTSDVMEVLSPHLQSTDAGWVITGDKADSRIRKLFKEIESATIAQSNNALIYQGLVKLLTVPALSWYSSRVLATLRKSNPQLSKYIAEAVFDFLLPRMDVDNITDVGGAAPGFSTYALDVERAHMCANGLIPLTEEVLLCELMIEKLDFWLSVERVAMTVSTAHVIFKIIESDPYKAMPHIEARRHDIFLVKYILWMSSKIDAATDLNFLKIYLIHLKIVSILCSQSRNMALLLHNTKFHIDYLFQWIRTTYTRVPVGGASKNLDVLRLQLISHAIECCTSLMSVARDEIINSLRLEDILLRLVFEEEPNVRLLNSALKGLRDILQSIAGGGSSAHVETFNYILRKLFLENNCKQILKLISADFVDALIPSVILMESTDLIVFENITNPLEAIDRVRIPDEMKKFEHLGPNDIKEMCANVIAIIVLCIQNVDKLDYCREVVNMFTQQHGALALLQTCLIPDSRVRGLSLECLSSMDLELFKDNELNKLLIIHERFIDLDAFNTLIHMEFYFKVWNSILNSATAHQIGDDSATDNSGWLWKTKYAEPLLVACLTKYRLCIEDAHRATRQGFEDRERETRRLKVCALIADVFRKTGFVQPLRQLFVKKLPRDFAVLTNRYGDVAENLLLTPCAIIHDSFKHEENTSLMNEPTHIERTWGCRSMGALARILSEQLHVRKKMCFRVMVRLAELVEGVKDELFQHRSMQLLTSEEATGWPPLRDKLNNLSYLDEEELEVRLASLQQFVEISSNAPAGSPGGGGGSSISTGPTEGTISSLQSYMLSLIDAEQAMTYQQTRAEVKLDMSMEYWAGRLKGQLLEIEDAMQEKDKNRAVNALLTKLGVYEEIPLSTDPLKSMTAMTLEKEPAGNQANEGKRKFVGKWLVCQALQRVHGDRACGIVRDEYQRRIAPPNVTFGANDARREMRPCFAVHAYLRLIYAMINLAPTPQIRESVVNLFRTAKNMKDLIALVDSCSPDAALYSKLALVLDSVIKLQPYESVQSMDALLTHWPCVDWAHSLMPEMINIIERGIHHPLSKSEENMALSIARLLETVFKQLSFIKFGIRVDVQTMSMKLTYSKFITPRLLDYFSYLISFYLRLQQGFAKGSTAIHLLYGHETLQTFEHSLEAILNIVAYASANVRDQTKSILVQIFRIPMFYSMPIRSSMLRAFLKRIALNRVRQTLQLQLSVQRKAAERILFVSEAWLNGEEVLVALSTVCLYVLKNPFLGRDVSAKLGGEKTLANGDLGSVVSKLAQTIYNPLGSEDRLEVNPEWESCCSPKTTYVIQQNFEWGSLLRITQGQPWTLSVGVCWATQLDGNKRGVSQTPSEAASTVPAYKMDRQTSSMESLGVACAFQYFVLPTREKAMEFIEYAYALSGRVVLMNDIVMREWAVSGVRKLASDPALAKTLKVVQNPSCAMLLEENGKPCKAGRTVLLMQSELVLYLFEFDAMGWFSPPPIALDHERNWTMTGVEGEDAQTEFNHGGLTNFVAYTTRSEKERTAILQLRELQVDGGAGRSGPAGGVGRRHGPGGKAVLDLLPAWALGETEVSQDEIARKKYLGELESRGKKSFRVVQAWPIRGVVEVLDVGGPLPTVVLGFSKKLAMEGSEGVAKNVRASSSVKVEFLSYVGLERWLGGLGADLYSEDPVHWKRWRGAGSGLSQKTSGA